MEYLWDGKPIKDIREWTEKKGGKMLKIEKTWKEYTLGGKVIDRREVLEMPSLFWECFRYDGKFNMKVID